MTKSEELFESFCKAKKINFDRIPTGKNQTPDYMLHIAETDIVVEVKQIDMNTEDKKQNRLLLNGGSTRLKRLPGKRARKKISHANRQLAELTNGSLPSILVLYDNIPSGFNTDPYNILTAMYGLEEFVISAPSAPKIPPYISDLKFGSKRKMTPTTNTNTSAVATMFSDSSDPSLPPNLVIYHNIYAKVPLSPDIPFAMGVKQFTLGKIEKGKPQRWAEVTDD